MTSRNEPANYPDWQSALLQRHQLDAGYLESAREWFAPLAEALLVHQKSADRPVLIALNGCQGSGKTTMCDYLCSSVREEHGLNAVSLSLDDFYLSRAERQVLASNVHPLLATRGVPGTHDVNLLRRTLEQLLDPGRRDPVVIPRFNKASDDRRDSAEWDIITPPVHLVLLEGWCLGAQPVPSASLSTPLNELERDEDAAAVWRGYSNEVLRSDFPWLYQRVDQWVMLCAPSFSCVFDWRCEQEHKLAATLLPGQASRLMDDDSLRRFIQHYERITLNCLDKLPAMVNYLFSLDLDRRITACQFRQDTEVSP